MKTTGWKKALFIAALVAAPTSFAVAGFKQSAEVFISDPLTRAMGSLGSARNSADLTQYIGCTVYTFSNGSATMTCTARDSTAVTRSCSTNNTMAPGMVEAARHITTDSYIFFKWGPGGECTELHITNNSYHAPKKP
jgi:hypothetical protein